ncbi:MAG: pilus assembly protein PilM [Nitrospiria bacterium]
MGQIILGLDIGSTSVKGVRLAKGLRGIRLMDCFQQPVDRTADETAPHVLTAGQTEALKTLVTEGKIIGGDLIALSLPGNLISSRELFLPFSDPKKLEQIVPYEIEGELPFGLEDLTVDYMLLQKCQADPSPEDASAQSRLLVFAIQNDILRGYLDALQQIGIDPAWVGPDPLALFAFSRYCLESGSEDADSRTENLMIDIGATRTVLCDTQGGALQWIRTLPMGGDRLTATLQKRFDLSWETAEMRKTEADPYAKPSKLPETQETPTLEKDLGRWILEIEKTLRTLSPHPGLKSTEAEGRARARFFHLCGGGARLGGLREALSKILDMSPAPVDLGPGSRIASIEGIEGIDADLISSDYAQAFGSAFQESDGPPINFRKGVFVFGKEAIEKRRRFVSVGLVALFLLGLMGADFYFRYALKEQRYQALKENVRSTFSETFPNIRNVVNEVDQTRTAITALKQTEAFLGLGEMSPLDVLTEVTAAVPEGVKIDVFDIVIDSGNVRIQAQTDSFESVDRIRGGLMGGKTFRNVEVSDAKVMADQSRVRFRIKMSVAERKDLGKNRPS